MPNVIPEDYSVDLRTILAKERTLLAHQGVQLTKIGLSMGVFASGLAIIKFITTDESLGLLIAALLMSVSALVGVMAYIRFHELAADLANVIEVEEKMAHSHRKTILEAHAKKNE